TGERYTSGDVQPPPRLVARTAGAAGGRIEAADGRTSEGTAAALPGPPIDAHGAGDCFAARVTLGLAAGSAPHDPPAPGGRCGASCVTGRGPYTAQLASDG